MFYKTMQLKADETGKISGFFSTYEKSPDSYGDIIEPGAFSGTIARRKETGHPFPLCFNHNFDHVIGAVNTVEEKENGPYIEADFIKTQQAQDVREMVKSGAIYQFSFAYDILKRRDPDDEERKNGVENVLQELEVYEVSIVTVPANQNAVMTDIKSLVDMAVKSGRRNRKSDEDIIRNCIESLKSLLDDGEEDKPEEEDAEAEKAESETNEASEESKTTGNSEKAAELLEKIKSIKEVPDHDN